MDANKSIDLTLKNKRSLIVIIALGVLIKIILFSFAVIHAPQSKFMNDSVTYLKTSEMLMSQGAFAVRDANGALHSEFYRTPGYPLFLGILTKSLNITLNGVIFIQVLLTILAAFITYRAAVQIEPKTSFLSAVIVLFSPVISIFSLMLLTEVLFLLFISLFMYCFIKYLKTTTVKAIAMSSVTLVLATYVRPGAYYLGMVLVIFLVCANASRNIKRTIGHCFIFLIIVYGLLGVWQIRNYLLFKDFSFSSILNSDYAKFGLYKSYLRNTDPYTRGMAPLPYYINSTSRCFLSIMSRPGSFKYFNCRFLSILGNIVGYLWVVFLMSGFLYGATKIWRERSYQFLLLIIIYFIFGSILAEGWAVCQRYQIPAIPFIAIISAYGWACWIKRYN